MRLLNYIIAILIIVVLYYDLKRSKRPIYPGHQGVIREGLKPGFIKSVEWYHGPFILIDVIVHTCHSNYGKHRSESNYKKTLRLHKSPILKYLLCI